MIYCVNLDISKKVPVRINILTHYLVRDWFLCQSWWCRCSTDKEILEWSFNGDKYDEKYFVIINWCGDNLLIPIKKIAEESQTNGASDGLVDKEEAYLVLIPIIQIVMAMDWMMHWSRRRARIRGHPDSDGDGLSDGEKFKVGRSLADSDGDGFDDAFEQLYGYDPNNPNDFPSFLTMQLVTSKSWPINDGCNPAGSSKSGRQNF